MIMQHNSLGKWDKRVWNTMGIHRFERQLLIPIIVVIVNILAPIVHGKVFHYPNTIVQLPMLQVVCNQIG
ncbi:hypothetical protein DCM91_01620 [Chitinophaga costaii]|nr:hypothetical protein DCM91_01620 [Chitinophaga costaii]